jgi:opacity protein-like surface antigen
MFKTKTNLLLLLLSSSNLSFASETIPYQPQDENNYYVGASLDYQRIYNHDPEFIDYTATQDTLGGLTLIMGYKNLLDQYITNKDFSLDIEGRITKSFWEESFADSLRYSIFAKPQYSFYHKQNIKNLKVYGLLGLGQLSIEGNNGEIPAHENMIGQDIYSDVSFQWGLGISADINEKLSLFIDYTSLISDADIDSTLYYYDSNVYQELSADAVNVGLTYKFNLDY